MNNKLPTLETVIFEHLLFMSKNSEIKRINATGSDLLRGSSNNTAREISSVGRFRTLKLDTINVTLTLRIFSFYLPPKLLVSYELLIPHYLLILILRTSFMDWA